VVFINYW